MKSNTADASRQNLYLITIIAFLVGLGLSYIYTTIDPTTQNRYYLFALAIIPNIVSGLIAFIVIYAVFHIRGIDTSLTQAPPVINQQSLVRELTPKLVEAVRQASISDDFIQKLVRELTPLLTRFQGSTGQQININTLVRELTPKLVGAIRQTAISDASIQAIVKGLTPQLTSIETAMEPQLDNKLLVRNHVANQFQQSYLMVYNFRSDLYEYYSNRIGHFDIRPEYYGLFQNICRLVTDSARLTLIEHFKAENSSFGDDVAITVKMIIPTNLLIEIFPQDQDEKHINSVKSRSEWVITVFRDSHTYTTYRYEREVRALRLYTIEGNTAFNTAYHTGEIFLSNNLTELHNEKQYDNENPSWHKHYNATLVVPIQYHDKRTDVRVCHGFLAADSKNTGNKDLYDADICAPILKHGAELLATFFLILAIAHSMSGNATNS